MNGTSRVTLRWPSLIAGALVLLALGAGLAYVAMRPAPATVRATRRQPLHGLEQRSVAGGAANGAQRMSRRLRYR